MPAAKHAWSFASGRGDQSGLSNDKHPARNAFTGGLSNSPPCPIGAPGIAEDQWPTVLQRVVENHESYRKVAADYEVSRETIRRLVRAAHCLSMARLRTDGTSSQHRRDRKARMFLL